MDQLVDSVGEFFTEFTDETPERLARQAAAA
jgi:hypothetical protein